MSTCIGKSSWPELVGRLGREAERIIENENTLVDAIVVDDGSSVTTDFRCDRVWVWVSRTTGNVIRTPFIGESWPICESMHEDTSHWLGKSSWPELVGRPGCEAERIIESENPSVDAIIVEPGQGVGLDFSCKRVWVWVSSTGIVIRIPSIG